MRATRLVLGASLLAMAGWASAVEGPPAGLPVPRPVVSARSAETSSKDYERLRQKLAQRDELQREIEELSHATQTPQQVLVRVQMMEVNLTKLREMGMEFANYPLYQSTGIEQVESSPTPDDSSVELEGDETADPAPTSDHKAFCEFLKTLERNGLARTLADPTLATTSGRPSSFKVGGEYPLPSSPGSANAVEYHSFGTELDVVATTLGANKVRLEVRPRVSELDATNSIVVGGQSIPSLRVQQCDTSCETSFGETVALGGLVQERTVVTGNRKEIVRTGLWVFVTPEFMQRTLEAQAPGNTRPSSFEDTRVGARPGTKR